MSPRIFFAVLTRELLQRRLMVVAAALLGLFPLLAPSLPGLALHRPEAVRQSALFVILAIAIFSSPLALGASLLSRELVEGRLAFYFARPVPALELWLGKLGAAVLLLLGCLGLIVSPSLIIDPALLAPSRAGEAPALPLLGYPETAVVSLPGQTPVEALPAGGFALALGALLVAALMATHVASTLVRVRSAWLLLDVALAAVVAGLVVAAREILLSRQAFGLLGRFETWMLAGFLPVFLLAGWLQVRFGRGDALRSRKFLALAVWPGLLVVTLTGLVRAWDAVHPSWSDARSIAELAVSPDGRHAAVGAWHPGHGSIFLADLESGGKEPFASLPMFPSLRFAPDGGRLFWLDCRRLAPPDCEVVTKDLRADSAPLELGIEVDQRRRPSLDMTPSGDRIAVVDWRRAAVYAAPSGRLLGSVGGRALQDARFLDADRLLLAASFEGRTRLSLWDLRSRRVSRLVSDLPGEWLMRAQQLDVDRRRLFYTTVIPRVHRVIELETGALLADLEPLVERHGLLESARWLEDGRLLISTVPADSLGNPAIEDGFDATLLLVDLEASGSPQQVVLPAALELRLGPELEPGKVLVAKRHRRPPPPPAVFSAWGIDPLAGWSTWLLELPPVEASPGEEARPPRLRALAGGMRPTAARYLFEAGDGALVRWDPLGGELELALAPPGYTER